jgi:iron complex outermembrane receptor protein
LAKRKGVEPEVVKTFELGLKSAFNNGRVQTNIAAFTTDYTNVQIPGSVPTFNAAGAVVGFSGSLTNAGKAKINGLELEATARITDAFRLTGMVSYTKTIGKHHRHLRLGDACDGPQRDAVALQ